MIIKSLSRKSDSYDQLVAYMQQGSHADFTVYHNVYRTQDSGKIIEEFESMGGQLPQRKNGNMLYHEILSLKRQEGIDLEEQKHALYAMVQEYLQERASGQLGYGCMHIEKEHLHMHLMLSPNRIDRPSRRVRLTKAQLWDIQGRMEMFLQERWPQLRERSLYSRSAPPAFKKKDREFQLEQRTGKPSVKSQVKEKLQVVLEQSTSQTSFKKHLDELDMQLVIRGKNPVIVATGRRYRLQTLGLLPAYERLLVLDGLAQQMKSHNNPIVRPQETNQESSSPASQVKTVTETQTPVPVLDAPTVHTPVKDEELSHKKSTPLFEQNREPSRPIESPKVPAVSEKTGVWQKLRETANKAQTVIKEFRGEFHESLEKYAQSKEPKMHSREEFRMPPREKETEERLARLKKAREKEQPQRTEPRRDKEPHSSHRQESQKADQNRALRKEQPKQREDRESQERLNRLRKAREQRSRNDRQRDFERD
ncbi:hypothetical protein COW36_03480 [bacterium (Candidatus Blackallbacteria) CG17_big_fil_post_rev_8_21_14_2_50_48_46]|uniref:MobA/VirD2-like nuclease domain-containing protein n=1 Tax=bacterium (Candidatus Blackallbacteria) CG17_big_fil_post_rev_8_21_14_2_50_48_46 TaxID=2014261 RepID=A0A2M7G9H5_9BACT|nr:MAG: hypothetical protein COW64_25900 [bacterium (Candidatus Blackallbacteria) CG18_big_fil_WC_8_21_14_2_50_49_26]PIW18772.1 MAG: hypothetical protein COW36_03480 [bacterium (Candidatus Blackallbacteria) CG17_big_fil_post_rev_8_21_14_2_50_48_46]PIW49459.1 MAG: hypothetical protein COW20_05845 [bacterium (Candidatus Blackallbacteria) CG13_big_fil_rev_8_21_14_2_50_49_14]